MPRVVHIPSIVVSSWTFTPETVDTINTLPAVGARVGQAFVDVGLAMLAGEAGDALAGVPKPHLH